MKKTEAITGSGNWSDARFSNEELAAQAFTMQSGIFDTLYSNDIIIQYKRKRVRDHVNGLLPLGSNILELNAGTGEDAIYFANQGYRVHATDISTGMLDILKRKALLNGLDKSITSEKCSFTSLETLEERGPYDMLFSNFAGLNCTEHLEKVLLQLPNLLKPGGLITLVLLPKFCLWESLLFLKGKWKTAFRRFNSSKGTRSHIEGNYFKCWYYNPSFVSSALNESFELVTIEGLCTLVPPSYISNFAEKYPKSYAWLVKQENHLKGRWPWKFIGDYYIITLRKKEGF